jgi:hypothetical protein
VPRNWPNLSDYEFEALVGDLYSAELGVRFQRFPRGRDGGIDLRHLRPGRVRPDVIQAKHYQGSRFSDLRTAARKEKRRLETLGLSTSSYRLVTSLGLTAANKSELAEILSRWIRSEDWIVGRDDLEDLLDEHPQIERKHVKLWLGSSTHLAAYARPGTHARSRVLAQSIARSLPLYVQGRSFAEAMGVLDDAKILLIAGEPGIGKTTLARLAVGAYIEEGYEPIEVSRDIEEAWDVWDEAVPQIFLYDDFLGRTMLGELSKNEDSRLLSFMAEVESSPRTRLVLTTREYILQEAAQTFEAFRRAGVTTRRFVLALPSYTSSERARILHNHVWHSQLAMSAKEELVADRGYRRIVRHANFNPRLIEYITGMQRGHPVRLEPGATWLEFAVDALDHPNEIWNQAFQRELGDHEQQLLLCLVTMPDEAEINDLERAFTSWMTAAGRPTGTSHFEAALQVLDGSFTASRLREGNVMFCAPSNPGLADFLNRQLTADPQRILLAARSAVFFDQVERLVRLLRNAPPTGREPAYASMEIAGAMRRLIDSPGARWGRHAVAYGRTVYKRMTRTAEDGLLSTLRISQQAEVPEGLQALTSEHLATCVPRWQAGFGDCDSVAAIARILVDPPIPVPEDWAAALVAMTLENAVTIERWSELAELTRIVPDQFLAATMEDIVERYCSFAVDELDSYGDEHGDEDSIDALHRLADEFGTELDDEDVMHARERMQERLSREDYLEDEDRGGYWGRDATDDRATAAEIDAMFGRLTD